MKLRMEPVMIFVVLILVISLTTGKKKEEKPIIHDGLPPQNSIVIDTNGNTISPKININGWNVKVEVK